jgi:prepilin-type processing-associated H-X9-DG protein
MSINFSLQADFEPKALDDLPVGDLFDQIDFVGMPCWCGNGPDFRQTARSMHPGGVMVAMCDGSVTWINDYIEVGITYGSPPGALRCGTSSTSRTTD